MLFAERRQAGTNPNCGAFLAHQSGFVKLKMHDTATSTIKKFQRTRSLARW
jgi:hypothetical protein